MHDDTLRLQSKLQKLEELLEKQRWAQKEQALKFEKATDKLERELEEQKFQSDYNKEQIERYRLVLDNLSEGIYAMDADGNVFPMNTRATELLDEASIVPILLEASTGRRLVENVEVASTDYSPQAAATTVALHMVKVSARPLTDDEGKIVGSVAMLRAGTDKTDD